MDTRTSWGLIALVLVSIAVLFALKLAPSFSSLQSETYLSSSDVQGIEVVHRGLPYTLNFEQQTHLVALLNQSKRVERSTPSTNTQALPISKITIYRFGSSAVELEPLFYSGDNLIYNAYLWNSNGYMRDTSAGKLRDLLAETFDL